MSGRPSVPSAWDDDWTAKAEPPEPQGPPQPAPKVTKAERRAQHAAQQRQLWDSADNPGRNIWLESQGAVPLRQEPKPAVTLLSRKPPQIAKRSTPGGIGGLSLEDDEDSEEERLKKQASEREERARRAKIEHEEKQKRYAEARERIMGASSQTSLLASSSRESSSQGRDPRRQKGRPGSNYGNNGNGNGSGYNAGQRRSQPETPVEQSPARQVQTQPPEGQLFDPEDTGRRPGHKREISFSNAQDRPVRQPRGPEVSGRGGFGFSSRGGVSNA